MTMAGKVSQDSVHYTDGPVDKEPCRDCSMFVKPDSCTAVSGDISERGHCDLWAAASKRTAMPDIQRKFVAGAVVADGSVGERQIRVVASDATPDRAKDVMVPSGCQVDNYRKNNIVLADHDPTKPIGNADVAVKADRVEALITFAPAGISEKADEYCALAKAGVIKSVSVGFDPLEAEPRKGGGFLYKAWELMELSVLGGVPCNPSALVIARSANAAGQKADSSSEWKVGASRNLPLDDDDGWDGDAAKASIFEHAKFDGDSPDTTFARKGFLVYDSANPTLKGSYKLPFARVKDGRLIAAPGGLRNAASRLPQTDGLSDDTQTKARAVIDHYEAKMKDADGKSGTAPRNKQLGKNGKVLIKDLWSCADLAYAVANLGFIHDQAAWEAEIEQDASKLPAMLAAVLQEAAAALVAMVTEETGELLAGRGIDVMPDDEAYVALGATPQAKSLRAAFRKAAFVRKAGRVISEANMKHLKEVQDHLKAMGDLHVKAADLHDDVHDVLQDWMNHGTSAGEHIKAILKSADDGDDSSDCDPDTDPNCDPDGGDNELSAAAAQRKRAIAILELERQAP